MSNALQKDDNLLTGVSKQMSTCDIIHAKQQYFFFMLLRLVDFYNKRDQ